jgi:hypothetical protein
MYCFQDHFSQLIWVLLGSRRGPMLCNRGTSMVRSPECVPCRTFLRHWKISIKSTIFTIAIKNQRTLPCRQGPKLRDCICKMRLQNIDISHYLPMFVGDCGVSHVSVVCQLGFEPHLFSKSSLRARHKMVSGSGLRWGLKWTKSDQKVTVSPPGKPWSTNLVCWGNSSIYIHSSHKIHYTLW